ncbi:perilipin-3-like isoform X2 [Bufo gargarizans]|uniref:perilipin-3-like isoform X2 n=1 Tax=Bufo gargarizans TaxID=30331 RepID=UPI001CF1743B|nr:perilipin-3-like isoform X2 [Bufo gargarizans]
MSSDDTNTPVQVAEAAEQQQNVVERVTQLPLVSSACSMVSAVYNSTKDSHPYIRNVCDVAEKGAKTLTDVAVTGSKPILSRLEPQIATANDLACKGLDKLESTLPILQKPTEKVVSDTKELVTGARDAVVGVVTNTVTGTRDTVTSAVSGIMGLAAGAVQGSMGLTRSVVSTVMDTQVGQFVTSSLDTVLGKSEELVDHYLPMTDEELSQLASTVEGFEVAPLQQQKEQQSYYVRLGSLSSRLRHRAYQHSLGKMETVKQSVHGGQEKLHQLWLEWSRKQSKTESVDGARKDDQPLDSRVLTMTRTLTKQLQTTCFTLVSGAQGLPANIQDRMQQLRQTAQDLHSSFSSVHSFGDISSGILAQSREQASKVHDHVNELLSYVVANTPLTWLVGPFAPQLVEHPEMPEEQPEKVQ